MENPAQKSESTPNMNQLLDELASLKRENKELREDLNYYQELVRHLKRLRFSPSSEKFPSGQKTLFDEAETIPAPVESSDEDEENTTPKKIKKRGRPVRSPLPADLPREEKIIDLPDHEKICLNSGEALTVIGREVSEQLDIDPMRAKVIRTIRLKYGCDCSMCLAKSENPDNDKNDVPRIKIAPVEPQPIPKSIASPGLLAYVVVGKYADALPLYRQEGIFKRNKIDISRSTLASWVIKCGELITPIINLAWDELRKSAIIQSDETPLQVLKRSGKSATGKSYMWVFMNGGRDGPKIVLYELGPSRSHTVPLRYLEEYKGYLQTDGYEGYNTLAGKLPDITLVADWVHVRRRFDDAVKAIPKDFKGEIKAKTAFDLINALFRIDREDIGKDRNDADILNIRQEKSKPVVEALKKWLDETENTIPPKSLTGSAVSYLRDQWPKLLYFLDDPRLRLDTNPVEGAIRPFVIGRNKRLFSDTIKGAEASAALYSLIAMARLNELNPFDYLKVIFAELPKAKTLTDIEALLPWTWKPTTAA